MLHVLATAAIFFIMSFPLDFLRLCDLKWLSVGRLAPNVSELIHRRVIPRVCGCVADYVRLAQKQISVAFRNLPITFCLKFFGLFLFQTFGV